MNGKPSIAIVDDELDICALLTNVFQTMGASVCFIAPDGPEAIEKFKNADPRPGVEIIDYRLPSMSGLDVMKRILAIEPRTRIVFISGDESSRQESLDAGATVFMKKPASIKTITDTVTRLIDL
ncbi:MAG TPA: response regulator [Methanocella sp.]|uniref:response regulator n=1 Tax=Methanocella sp. TaxID=2052833 RepID=UPI002C379618|nr:response regulator [Methanocella sp.]HTY90320.1 response regulator [Methanocella sp.]